MLSQTKALRLPVNYAHLFDFAEKYSQIQCQLCACHLPAETCDCVRPDAAAEGSSKGSQTEVQGTKFKAEILYRQCVWSRPAFLVGEAEEESRTASGALWTGSARENKLTLATVMFWATR